MEFSLEGETKVYVNGLGHMTKMAATPIYSKTNINIKLVPSKVLFYGNNSPVILKLSMQY